MRALVVETCQRAGILDLREFYLLPEWVQASQLGHTVNLITGAYTGKAKPTGTPPAQIQEIIERQCRHREAQIAGGAQ